MNKESEPVIALICFLLLALLLLGYFGSREINHEQLNNYLEQQKENQ